MFGCMFVESKMAVYYHLWFGNVSFFVIDYIHLLKSQ